MADIHIRPIEVQDNPHIERIIRQVLTEFGANKPGFAWQDPELSRLSEAYQSSDRCYLVALDGEHILGGAGIAPFDCDEEGVCELQKMYLLPESRGLGVGQRLMSQLMIAAKAMGYQQCYLETIGSMEQANQLYQKNGFKRLSQRLGNSGHNACDVLYLRDL
jgi:putative acetyltransferase